MSGKFIALSATTVGALHVSEKGAPAGPGGVLGSKTAGTFMANEHGVYDNTNRYVCRLVASGPGAERGGTEYGEKYGSWSQKCFLTQNGKPTCRFERGSMIDGEGQPCRVMPSSSQSPVGKGAIDWRSKLVKKRVRSKGELGQLVQLTGQFRQELGKMADWCLVKDKKMAMVSVKEGVSVKEDLGEMYENANGFIERRDLSLLAKEINKLGAEPNCSDVNGLIANHKSDQGAQAMRM